MRDPNDVRRAVLAAITSVAPEVDPNAVDAKRPLREQLDLDSMDFLNVIVAIHRDLGVDVPERDYAKLATLDSAVAYLVAKP